MTDAEKAMWIVDNISPSRIEEEAGVNRRTVYNLKTGKTKIETSAYQNVIKLAKMYDDIY